MIRISLVLLGLYYLSLGFILLVAPEYFYTSVPGVSATGPYNAHFLRDVGFAFLTSAGGLLSGSVTFQRPIIILGAAWPLLHACFHLWMWLAAGMPIDRISGFDWAGVIVPAFIAGVLAIRMKEKRT